MGEKTKLNECRLFFDGKPVAMGKIAEPINLDCGLGKIGDSWKGEKGFSIQGKVSFDVPMTNELKRLQEEIVGDFKRQYSEWLKRVDVAVRKILTEYIDNPFTTDPSKATKEEFEKRHINALVYQGMADGSQAFVGIQQGTTLICVDGTRIENFGKQ